MHLKPKYAFLDNSCMKRILPPIVQFSKKYYTYLQSFLAIYGSLAAKITFPKKNKQQMQCIRTQNTHSLIILAWKESFHQLSNSQKNTTHTSNPNNSITTCQTTFPNKTTPTRDRSYNGAIASSVLTILSLQRILRYRPNFRPFAILGGGDPYSPHA